MTACPRCGEPGRHVGVSFPIEDPMGEVLVVHHCDNHDQTHVWNEPAREPWALMQRALDVLSVGHGWPKEQHSCRGAGGARAPTEGIRALSPRDMSSGDSKGVVVHLNPDTYDFVLAGVQQAAVGDSCPDCRESARAVLDDLADVNPFDYTVGVVAIRDGGAR